MILVTGANGGLGKSTILALKSIDSNIEVRAMVRNLQNAAPLTALGADVVQGDYFDYGAMRQAFDGVDDLLLISAPAFTDRDLQQRNAISAAVDAGVKRIIYTSIQHKNDSSFRIPMVTDTEIATKEMILNSNISYTIVNNTLYADALEYFLGPNPLIEGISISSGDGRGAFVKRDDIANGLARLLISGRHLNEEINFSNINNWSAKDIADILSELHRAPVHFLNNTREEYIHKLILSGLPKERAVFSADWADAIAQGEMDTCDVTLANLLGRKPESLESVIKDAFNRMNKG